MNDTIVKKQDNNWLLSFALLGVALIFSLALYLIFSGAYGSLNPFNWARKDLVFYLITALSVSFPLTLNYVVTQYEIDLEEKVDVIFDYNEFKSKKFLDALLTHYGNVATTGLFFMGLIYTIRGYSETFIGPFVISFFSVVIFFIYALYMFRLAMGMAKYKRLIYFPTVMLVVFFDMQLIEMFILSVPKP
ncbi:hypothetical protein ACVD1N_25070 [Vibrio parahaemolyticus]|nr:hypothetical protein [Vibrio parahaemolyticus]EKH9202818.1 hypothetical protein [Vibrio parahaemolyticus]